MTLGRDRLHELGIIFNCANETVTWQKILISIKFPNLTAKEFFVIKESRPVWNTTKRIKQILDGEFKKINLKSTIRTLIYLKDKHKNLLLESLQKYENKLLEPCVNIELFWMFYGYFCIQNESG